MIGKGLMLIFLSGVLLFIVQNEAITTQQI